jgi:hypothetical protein
LITKGLENYQDFSVKNQDDDFFSRPRPLPQDRYYFQSTNQSPVFVPVLEAYSTALK